MNQIKYSLITFLSWLSILFCSSSMQAQVVSTFAGTAGSSGTTDNTGAAARFNNPARRVYNKLSQNT